MLPRAHMSIPTAARVAWHLFQCRGLLRVVRAGRVSGIWWPLLLGTCRCALVVAGGASLWRACWPRVVCRASSDPVALFALVGVPGAVVPFPGPGAYPPDSLGGCAGPVKASREPGSWCLRLAPAKAVALGLLASYLFKTS